MKPWITVLAVALGSLSAIASLRRAEGDDALARGRYLVHDVAQCVQCHTPRDAAGALVESKLFEGAVVPVGRPFEALPWATRAPYIRGLTGFSDEQVIELLVEGSAAGRTPPKPPMPSFHMTREDARAVGAYLRSLGANGG